MMVCIIPQRKKNRRLY